MTTLGHYRPIMRLNITVVTTRSVGVAESKSIHGAFSRTLRRYNADGCLPGQRFSGGRRIFSVTELEAIRHRGRSVQVKTSEGAVLVYGRMSSRRLAKEGHLGQPMGRLREATAGRMVAGEFCNVAWGLSDRRPSLRRASQAYLAPETTQLWVTHPDRLACFGAGIVDQLLAETKK